MDPILAGFVDELNQIAKQAQAAGVAKSIADVIRSGVKARPLTSLGVAGIGTLGTAAVGGRAVEDWRLGRTIRKRQEEMAESR